MAKAPKTTKTQAPKATVQAESGVLPVVALNKIVYGAGQKAVAGSMFAPTSQGEYDELFRIQAVRKPTEAELAVYAQVAGTTSPKAATPVAELVGEDTQAAGDGGETAPGESGEDTAAGGSEDPLG